MEKQVAAFIPVRGGSKSIPLKNIRPIAGKPLVHWTVDAALACDAIDVVYVATDSPMIREVLTRYLNDPRFRLIDRSEATATDEATTESAMIEFAQKHEPDVIVLMQATSPMVTPDDLARGVQALTGDFDSVVSVVRQKRFLWKQEKDGTARPINYDPQKRPRRQNWDGFLVENGAFYITTRAALLDTDCRISGRVATVEMPEETYLEIDEPADWLAVEQLLLACDEPDVFAEKARDIRLFVTDVDGVLTDAGMYYSEKGDEIKKFNTRDGLGLVLLKRAGIQTAIVTTETTKLVERRAAKLKVNHLRQGVRDKITEVKKLAEELDISLQEVAFVGDDINDLDLLREVGLACCPADAREPNKTICHYVAKTNGGEGCIREIADQILSHLDDTGAPLFGPDGVAD